MEGEQHITMVVLEFPPKLSCKIRVILLSLYGMYEELPSASELITLPRADKDLFIFFASSNVSPSAPVLLT